MPAGDDVDGGHNTIDLSSNRESNATLQSSTTDVRVEDNLLDGGACILTSTTPASAGR